MNLFINWGYDSNGPGLEKIVKELGVKNCYYNCNKITKKVEGVEYHHIDIDKGYDEYKNIQQQLLPLDAELLDKMSCYESTAKDIIWRWRRSLSTDESYKNINDIYKKLLRYWNNFLLENKIDMIILFNIPHVPSLFLIYSLAKIHSIPIVLMQYLAAFDNGYRNKFITNDYNASRNKSFVDRYTRICSENTEKNNIELNEGLETFFTEYCKTNNDIKRVISTAREPLAKIMRLAYERFNIYVRRRDYRILIKKIVYYLRYIPTSKRLLNKIGNLESSPKFENDFFFFPLHYQPEATTLPLAERYADLLMIIDMVSKALPDNIDLYVKEHPSFWKVTEKYEGVNEARNIEFYEYISKLQNVILVKHDYSSLELIDKSLCVVTATGTAALESVFKAKPVMVFSDFIYSLIPTVFRIYNYDDCKCAIDRIVNEKVKKHELDTKALKIFFKALEPDFFRVGLSQGIVDTENSSMSLQESDIVTASKIIDYIKRNYFDAKE